jgi:hypothetical protein
MYTKTRIMRIFRTIDGKEFEDQAAAIDNDDKILEDLEKDLDLRRYLLIGEKFTQFQSPTPLTNDKLGDYTVEEVNKTSVTVYDHDEKMSRTMSFENWNKDYRHQIILIIERFRGKADR